MRMVRRRNGYLHEYLYRFDDFGIPQWMPKDRATYYPTSKMAHAMRRLAERYYAAHGHRIVVVKLRSSQPSSPSQKKDNA